MDAIGEPELLNPGEASLNPEAYQPYGLAIRGEVSVGNDNLHGLMRARRIALASSHPMPPEHPTLMRVGDMHDPRYERFATDLPLHPFVTDRMVADDEGMQHHRIPGGFLRRIALDFTPTTCARYWPRTDPLGPYVSFVVATQMGCTLQQLPDYAGNPMLRELDYGPVPVHVASWDVTDVQDRTVDFFNTLRTVSYGDDIPLRPWEEVKAHIQLRAEQGLEFDV